MLAQRSQQRRVAFRAPSLPSPRLSRSLSISFQFPFPRARMFTASLSLPPSLPLSLSLSLNHACSMMQARLAKEPKKSNECTA